MPDTPTPAPTATSTPTPSPKPATPTPTAKPNTPTPTEAPPTPTAKPNTPTPTEVPPTPTPTPIPQPDIDINTYVAQLERTHIVPFLNGYSIESRSITASGKYVSGYEDYKVKYTCIKGEGKKVTFYFYTTCMSYNATAVKDEIYFDEIKVRVYIDGDGGSYWSTAATFTGVQGLASHITE